MTPNDDLLPPAYRAFHDAPGWQPGHYVSDEYGRVGFKSEHPSVGPTVIACKRQLWRGQISITPKVIGVGIVDGRTVVICLGDDPGPSTAWAFDPRRVSNVTTPEVIKRSKRARNVPAFHVRPDEHGVRVVDWLAGRVRLPGPVEDDLPEATLERFGVVA